MIYLSIPIDIDYTYLAKNGGLFVGYGQRCDFFGVHVVNTIRRDLEEKKWQCSMRKYARLWCQRDPSDCRWRLRERDKRKALWLLFKSLGLCLGKRGALSVLREVLLLDLFQGQCLKSAQKIVWGYCNRNDADLQRRSGRWSHFAQCFHGIVRFCDPRIQRRSEGRWHKQTPHFQRFVLHDDDLF